MRRTIVTLLLSMSMCMASLPVYAQDTQKEQEPLSSALSSTSKVVTVVVSAVVYVAIYGVLWGSWTTSTSTGNGNVKKPPSPGALAIYIDTNREHLTTQIALGSGPHIKSLAALYQLEQKQHQHFFNAVRASRHRFLPILIDGKPKQILAMVHDLFKVVALIESKDG